MKKGDVIEGVGVNFDSEDLQNVESLEDLQALGIFDHLDDDKRQKAEYKVLEKLGVDNGDNKEGQSPGLVP